MSERYIARYCLVLQDFRVFDSEIRLFMPGGYATWAQAQIVAGSLNYPPKKPPETAGNPCCDCAEKAKHYELVLETIRTRTDDEFAQRLADDALNYTPNGEVSPRRSLNARRSASK